METLKKELNLTDAQIIAATIYQETCIDLYSDTYNTTPEYDDMLENYCIEISGNGEYDYEFSDDFSVYVITGKMSKDLQSFIDHCKSVSIDDDDDE